MKTLFLMIYLFTLNGVEKCDAEGRTYLQHESGSACVVVTEQTPTVPAGFNAEENQDSFDYTFELKNGKKIAIEGPSRDDYTSFHYDHNTAAYDRESNDPIMIDLELFNTKLVRSHFAGHVVLDWALLHPGQHILRYSYSVHEELPMLSVWLDGVSHEFIVSSDPYLSDKDILINDFKFEQIAIRTRGPRVAIAEGNCPDLKEELSEREIILIIVSVMGTLVGVILIISCCVFICPILCRKVRRTCCGHSNYNDKIHYQYSGVNATEGDPRNSLFGMEPNSDFQKLDFARNSLIKYPDIHENNDKWTKEKEQDSFVDSICDDSTPQSDYITDENPEIQFEQSNKRYPPFDCLEPVPFFPK